ncbi:uncharacterized protein BP5553_01149 [Venustampulla echinocandica]|uniref:Uncharacterized protein n=1 Tax=Venustampulla echinocandica TaxID=2656787 RepID=A0A370U064_9HELO|nr:uncharacterized protein BP5553_01149 [Venustampulla echinocandica]RDL41170.1 hypothetical protein BP5553_01149 [Venustampulla echinocandica]
MELQRILNDRDIPPRLGTPSTISTSNRLSKETLRIQTTNNTNEPWAPPTAAISQDTIRTPDKGRRAEVNSSSYTIQIGVRLGGSLVDKEKRARAAQACTRWRSKKKQLLDKSKLEENRVRELGSRMEMSGTIGFATNVQQRPSNTTASSRNNRPEEDIPTTPALSIASYKINLPSEEKQFIFYCFVDRGMSYANTLRSYKERFGNQMSLYRLQVSLAQYIQEVPQLKRSGIREFRSGGWRIERATRLKLRLIDIAPSEALHFEWVVDGDKDIIRRRYQTTLV